MKTEVQHIRRGRIKGTVAVKLPSKESLINMVTNQVVLMKTEVGVAVLHPKDQLNKKKGAKIARERLRPIFLELSTIHLNWCDEPGRMHFQFSTDKPIILSTVPGSPKCRIDIAMTTHKNSEHTRLEHVLLLLEENEE